MGDAMRATTIACITALLFICGSVINGMCDCDSACAAEPAVVTPQKIIRPFNGKNLTGFHTFLKASGGKDPQRVFRATGGMLHITGHGAGYLATDDQYRNYRVKVEYKWGARTDGTKYVRNSGLLVHQTGAARVWPAAVEIQLAQGCEGDFIVIRGKDKNGAAIKTTLTSETRIAADGRTRWQQGGKKTLYTGRQFWWSKHQPGFKELRDTRGKDDVASPLGQWTRIEVICRGDTITVKVNGVTVNQARNVHPQAGHILLQNEGSEVYFRNFEIHPLE